MNQLTTITTTPGVEMRPGDKFTIGGVYEQDNRSRITRFWQWLTRKPTPKPPALRRFRVVSQYSSNCVQATEED